MLNRRIFGMLAGAAALGRAVRAAEPAKKVPFYSSSGPELVRYELDPQTASLARQGAVTLPANVQYAWPHPSRKYLYVVASNGRPGGGPIGAAGPDPHHYAIAYRVDPVSGALTPHGKPQLLPVRPLHVSVDRSGSYLLIAYNLPSLVTVHRLAADGTIGEDVPQTRKLDFGIYAHQVRATPSGRTVTLCSRGNDATASRGEDPGHIEIFGFEDGQLANLQTLFPGDAGLGFGPRHLDFHPSAPLVYVSLERENSLYVFGLEPDGRLTPEPLFKRNALRDPEAKAKHPGQGCGPIHVHPNGRFVYQTNRGSGTVDVGGKKVSNGGENNIAVYAIDQGSGAPTLVQHADAHGFELRTFAIDPTGQILIAASATSLLVQDGDKISPVSAGLSLYRIGADGMLSFVSKTDVDTSGGTQFWCGLLTIA
jgi:6-phosphogluconolactonase (cycloisomerase 2 family)